MSTVGTEPGVERSHNLLVILDAAPGSAERSALPQRFVDKIYQMGGTVTDVEVLGSTRAA